MFTINDDLSIYITRGDILLFNVTADEKGEEYKFQPGDVVRFTVYEKKACNCVVLQKDFPVMEETGYVQIFLDENDTRIGNLISKPVDYWYEIELNPMTAPQTIIGYDENGAKVFKLYPEADKVIDPEPETEPEDIPVVDGALDALSPRPVENRVVTAAILRQDEKVKKYKEAADTHAEDERNPHNVTKDQVGLGKVPNVATNDQTPTYGEAASLSDLISGEKLSAAFGKIGKAIKELISHLGNKENPHAVTAAQVKARSDTWMPSASDVGAVPKEHLQDRGNPHAVTAAQVKARPDTWLPSLEDIGAANAETLENHIMDEENPHCVSAEQVGARPDTWMPTAEEVGAVAKEGDQSIEGSLELKGNEAASMLVLSREVDGDTIKVFLNDTEDGGIELWSTRNGDVIAKIILAADITHLNNPLGVAGGGTGGKTPQEARDNLGITDVLRERAQIRLLWENDQPQGTFGAKTLDLDLGGYDWIAVEHRFKTDSERKKIDFGAVGTNVYLEAISKSGYVATRLCVPVEGAGISFSEATYVVNGEESEVTGYIVPQRIYGIKGVII